MAAGQPLIVSVSRGNSTKKAIDMGNGVKNSAPAKKINTFFNETIQPLFSS